MSAESSRSVQSVSERLAERAHIIAPEKRAEKAHHRDRVAEPVDDDELYRSYVRAEALELLHNRARPEKEVNHDQYSYCNHDRAACYHPSLLPEIDSDLVTIALHSLRWLAPLAAKKREHQHKQ